MTVLFLASKQSDIMANEMIGSSTVNYGDADFTQAPYMVVNTSAEPTYGASLPLYGETTLGETLWFHCRVWQDFGSFNSNGSGTQLQFYDTAGVLVAEVYTVSSAMALRLYGNTTVVTAALDRYTLPKVDGAITFDISLTVTATTLTMELYVAGGLANTITVSNTTSNRAKIDKITMLWNKMHTTYTTYIAVSEIIVTEAEPTVGWRLACMDPSAQGAYTQWNGDYTALDFNTYAAYIFAAETGLRESWEVTNYEGPTSGVLVRGVYMKYIAQAGGAGGPQSVRPMVVLDGVPFEADAQTLPEVQRQFMVEWAQNPDTLADWVPADFIGWEFGVRSET